MRVVVLVLLGLGIAACQSQESADCATLGDTSVAAGDVSAEAVGCGNGNDCDDGLFCTADSCKGGICVWEVVPYFCTIGGVCVPDDKHDPSNVCSKCQPAVDTMDWTVSADMDGFFSDGFVCFGGTECPYVENCKGLTCGDDGCGGLCGYGECDDARGEQ